MCAARSEPVEEPGAGFPVRLTIPARAEFISLGRLALTGLCRTRNLPEETVGDLKLALTEACSNVVRHAYEDGGAGELEILYDLTADRIAIEVADAGGGFVPPEREQPADEMGEGGLGIAIIRSLSDEFAVERRPSGGSRLRFVKLLQQ